MAENSTVKNEAVFIVKKGTLVVGKNVHRTVGEKVKESELTKAEREFFLADGTIEKLK